MKIKCDDCTSEFSQRKSLYVHARKFHNKNLPVSKKNPDFKCSTCYKLFSLKSTLRRHEMKYHKSQGEEGDHNYTKTCKGSRLLCPQESCLEQFLNYNCLRNHLNHTHNFKVEEENIEFISRESFEKWKDNLQQKNMSFYSLDSAPKKLSTVDAWKLFYNCHRSYSYIPKGKNIRSLKSTGSNKIGRACPSRLEVTMAGSSETPSKVMVKYWKTHFGHELQLGHAFLDKSTRAEIAGKLNEGVSFDHILDSIRDNEVNKDDVNRRLMILEKKDLHNIVRDFNISYKTKRHQNDAISVKLWVTEMQSSGESPVLFYKGQDEEDENTSLNSQDFALIIMTTFQADQLIMFGENKICVDGTHGTNAYDIQLYTIMTVDEFGTGCPVAYCFSNRCDEYIFSLFFKMIKLRVGIMKTKIFMSDDAPAFYNAWKSVMGRVDHKLLCTWHVDRNWRSNLNKVSGGVEKKTLVYKTLRVLLQMTDVNKFQTSLVQVLNDLNNDVGDYFRTHYANRSENWAYCYRVGLGINTNMYLESYHKILKHIYLEGRKVKRLDKTINAVMKIARDSLFKRLINITKNKRSEKIQQIIASHKSSEIIPSSFIETIEENRQWLVLSSSGTSVQYHVSFVQNVCSNKCLACSVCNICIHTFQCSCTDNVIKLNICKHIHACARLSFENGQGGSNSQCNLHETNEVSKLLDMSQNVTSNVSRNYNLINKFEIIIGLLHKVNSTEENSSIIERSANNIINLLNKENVISFETTDNVNVQQKIETQHRLYSTKSKKKTNEMQLTKPSAFEEAAIIEGFNTTNILNIHSDFDHTY